eukprot:g78764.t1
MSIFFLKGKSFALIFLLGSHLKALQTPKRRRCDVVQGSYKEKYGNYACKYHSNWLMEKDKVLKRDPSEKCRQKLFPLRRWET